MGFASDYISGRVNFPELIKEAPDPETGLIVIVPAYNEPGVPDLLNSLAACTIPWCIVELIIIVNYPDNASEESIATNHKTISDISDWKKEHPGCFFRIHTVDTSLLGVYGWNVGMARKAGMDEAVRRFDAIDNKDGIIVNLDADCTVETNYLSAIYNELKGKGERSGCSIYFEHPLKGNVFSEKHYSAIIQYELHLRYYFQGLAFACFPNLHHTVGSAIAVKVIPYIRAGGMNRRSAGEDFYFIQKLVQGGGYFNLYNTTVYPSPRSSVRVPFGTGATIKTLTENSGELLLTYNARAFCDLKILFSLVKEGSVRRRSDQDVLLGDLPESIRLFMGKEQWIRKITEIKANTSSEKSFARRFFGWFNMFMVVKYMNYVHRTFYKKKPVNDSALELLSLIGDSFNDDDPYGLLMHYRKMEKKTC